MGVISWIILGLIAGWLAGFFVNKPGSGVLMNIALGVVGAVVGGIIAGAIFGTGVTGINIWSIIVSVIGAVVVVWIYNAVVLRR
ncbi:GlsB/YeaQ/YmgE family stress response membrane protein [Roseiarcus sp.]|uniref:GlsB/YeaQ/YmgE family stress response membrane protein n=1 Tax=Roseiarcus sp. TaxID=1969460 RepID=UPI003F97FCD9